MIGLYTVKKSSKVTSIDKEYFNDSLSKIKNEITSHIGKFALLREKDGRNIFVYLIRIVSPKEGEYFCYDYKGKFRCTIRKYLDLTQIMTDEQRIVFLDL